MNEKERKKRNKRAIENENRIILGELDKIIRELEKNGIKHNQYYEQGLGDIVEGVLNKLGITQERFTNLFNLRWCNCDNRKKFLNGILNWHRRTK